MLPDSRHLSSLDEEEEDLFHLHSQHLSLLCLHPPTLQGGHLRGLRDLTKSETLAEEDDDEEEESFEEDDDEQEPE